MLHGKADSVPFLYFRFPPLELPHLVIPRKILLKYMRTEYFNTVLFGMRSRIKKGNGRLELMKGTQTDTFLLSLFGDILKDGI